MRHTEEARPDWPVGPYLRAARLAAGLDFEKAGEAADVSHTTIRQVERGWVIRKGVKVPIATTKSTVEAIAKAVGADQAEAVRLLGLTDARAARPRRRGSAVPPDVLAEIPDHVLIAELARRLDTRRATDQS
ncbi:helix-turn-helix domain-containing protein [Actinokineospora iranica]|uniref:Helix-turn-helix domain-containing protein n=1 Tax=Actinokineospora iranica TaxID=1271860 RepID=A0A1G6K1Y9_9PSEU|nr:helix-turn-helix transcriptional regulator [Actinokineospora iranica]SDC25020.1 Helix-turn-helix domain-containing protein [Actinokineospora iranica]